MNPCSFHSATQRQLQQHNILPIMLPPLTLILFPWTVFKQIPNIMTLHLNALVCVFKWCRLYNNITTLPLPQPPKLTVPPLWHLMSSLPPRFPVISNMPFFNSWICFRHDQTVIDQSLKYLPLLTLQLMSGRKQAIECIISWIWLITFSWHHLACFSVPFIFFIVIVISWGLIRFQVIILDKSVSWLMLQISCYITVGGM